MVRIPITSGAAITATGITGATGDGAGETAVVRVGAAVIMMVERVGRIGGIVGAVRLD